MLWTIGILLYLTFGFSLVRFLCMYCEHDYDYDFIDVFFIMFMWPLYLAHRFFLAAMKEAKDFWEEIK